MKILYWDDSDAVLESVTKKLEKLQHRVMTARTIIECKEALLDRDNPIDLFIADHSIDEKDGMTFIMGTKANDPELHIVILTPSILRSEFNQLQMCGIEVMKKPILLDQVVRPFLSPDKRRKKPEKVSANVPAVPAGGTNSGLLGIPEVAERPPGMPPPPGGKPAQKKGLTRLFARG